jgi:hypothetical protein
MIRPFRWWFGRRCRETRLAGVDGGAAGREPIEVVEFVPGRGEADVEAFGPLAVQPCSCASAMRVIKVVGDPGQSQQLCRVNGRSSGHMTLLSMNSEPNFHGPVDLPEFDPKGGIPSSVVADFRWILASTWVSLSLTPV